MEVKGPGSLVIIETTIPNQRINNHINKKIEQIILYCMVGEKIIFQLLSVVSLCEAKLFHHLFIGKKIVFLATSSLSSETYCSS